MSTFNDPNVIPIDRIRNTNTCTNCKLHGLCFIKELTKADLERTERIVTHRRPLSRGECLYHAGAPLRAIYVVRSGSLKTYTVDEAGREHVTEFHMPGELVGLDGIATEVHAFTAEALDTTSVCEIPHERLAELSATIPNLGRQLLRRMSQRMLSDTQQRRLLAKNTADERLAALFLDMAQRFRERGFSAREFNLSMTRTDIGNYLGLAMETVSRTFTRFQQLGLIEVDRRYVQIRDFESLRRFTAEAADAGLRRASL